MSIDDTVLDDNLMDDEIIETSSSLLSKFCEKPLKYVIQGTIALTFLGTTFYKSNDVAEHVRDIEQQITSYAGTIIYWIAQIGYPLAEITLLTLLGHMATTEVGKCIDESYYTKKNIAPKTDTYSNLH